MRVRLAFLAVLVVALFPAEACADVAHVIAPGETLTSIAAADGLTIAALARANGISPQAELIAGRTLRIPPRTDVDVDTATTATIAPVSRSTAPVTAATSAPVSVAAGAPVPTPVRVTSSEIAAVAGANGVPAALAEAVAWQESGWNNAEISKVGAVGVMQILPKTWAWIDSYLTPNDPLGTASAAENIRAGVLLLRQLLALTGGDERLAVAGYFQGLASVKRLGMYASTRRYVADVLALAQRFSG